MLIDRTFGFKSKRDKFLNSTDNKSSVFNWKGDDLTAANSKHSEKSEELNSLRTSDLKKMENNQKKLKLLRFLRVYKDKYNEEEKENHIVFLRDLYRERLEAWDVDGCLKLKEVIEKVDEM